MAESLQAAQSCSSQYILQLHFISSCYSKVMALKQDELCFHVHFCYQMSSESGEMAIGSCTNCHNFITERF